MAQVQSLASELPNAVDMTKKRKKGKKKPLDIAEETTHTCAYVYICVCLYLYVCLCMFLKCACICIFSSLSISTMGEDIIPAVLVRIH